ncbi:MAG TPA: protoporphyrinogen oxidase [Vicinamibacterales bacterium]|nr:protoporphyrinogen oxidase [Vicinamibacterales bacterium]
MPVDVAIIGGGIAGLATAYELSRRGRSFVVLERTPRPGGVIHSEQVGGFTIDGGPDSLLIQKPQAIELCEELGLGGRLVTTKPPRIAYIQRGGRLYPLPAASVLGIPTRIGPFIRTGLFTWPGKLRMGAELFIGRRDDDGDESIGSFMRRHFGREAVTYLAEPLLAGIHAGDVDRLSIKALFPRLVEAERNYGSLLRAFRSGSNDQPRTRNQEPRTQNPEPRTQNHEPRTQNQEPRTNNREPRTENQEPRTPNAERRTPNPDGAFKSLPGGLGELISALVAALGDGNVRTSAAATAITGTGPFTVRTEDGQAIEAAAVVVATPAYVTGRLLRERDVSLASLCAEIPYASAATVALAFRRGAIAHPLNGSGFVVPKVENTGLLAGSWLSSKWPHRAPDSDHVLLRTFVGGARDPKALDRSDAELVALSVRALHALIGISGDPLFTRVYRFDRGNAQHEVGHLQRIAAIDRALARHPGLFLTGSGFRGVGIPDCVADARATARQVVGWLTR